MITGAHTILFSTDEDADRAFVRDVLGFPHVDAGGGWLIFALPPAELALHPAEVGSHELMLITDDVQGLVAEMRERGVGCAEVRRERWGSITRITLPSGGRLGVYEPTHPSPLAQA